MNGFYFPVSYKMQFDAALVKLLIHQDQSQKNKVAKSTAN